MSDTLWRNGQGCCEEVRGRLGRLRIPFGKVHANMKSKEDQMGDVRADVFGFVMLSGSLSPIHTMHMALMDVARNVVQTVFNIPVPVGTQPQYTHTSYTHTMYYNNTHALLPLLLW
eukprot:GHVS01042484.1.p1 GENE.GHVS01042484.1~~GHVS01042484.1.p1  ORF type:complete len:116 (-),score=9.00 GHVS01042484.1:357-704(-)